jgi:hypothetical protein
VTGILADINVQGHGLPVLTIANVPHLRANQDYANRVIDKLLDVLLRIDTLRGTGRLFLP